jgi:hypothetical protein
MSPSRLAPRALLVLAGILSLGPAPGEVGGCGSGDVVADPVDFCIQSGSWDCRRQEFREEIDDVQVCVDELLITCSGRAWRPECEPFPTNAEAQICLDALARVDNVRVDSDGDGVFEVSDLAECRLCGGR